MQEWTILVREQEQKWKELLELNGQAMTLETEQPLEKQEIKELQTDATHMIISYKS